MKRCIIRIILIVLPFQADAHTLSRNLQTAFWQLNQEIAHQATNRHGRPDTIHTAQIGDTLPASFTYRNQEKTFGHKALRGTMLVFGIETLSSAFLIIAPESLSKWDKSKINPSRQFKLAYTMPPTMDQDHWAINYVGHPYQGGYYFNAVRSQGARFWPSAFFCLGHTLVWEYGIEAVAERPSIQDLIVTPIAGTLFGELIHRITMQMRRNGFSWYEKTFVWLFNPMYALNNGFDPITKKY